MAEKTSNCTHNNTSTAAQNCSSIRYLVLQVGLLVLIQMSVEREREYFTTAVYSDGWWGSVHFDEPRAVKPDARSSPHNLSGVDQVLQDRVVHSRQGAAAG